MLTTGFQPSDFAFVMSSKIMGLSPIQPRGLLPKSNSGEIFKHSEINSIERRIVIVSARPILKTSKLEGHVNP
jgi:hypothetical protein